MSWQRRSIPLTTAPPPPASTFPPTTPLPNAAPPPADTLPSLQPSSPGHPRATLDAAAFPHIIDAIFAHAPAPSLLVLRLVSRAFWVRANNEYARILTVTPLGISSPRGRLPFLPEGQLCAELHATSDDSYFARHYSPPPLLSSLRVSHLVLSLNFRRTFYGYPYPSHHALEAGRAGLDLSVDPGRVTVIFNAPWRYCTWSNRRNQSNHRRPQLRRSRLRYSKAEYDAFVRRLGEWAARGVPLVCVDAQLARCNMFPCDCGPNWIGRPRSSSGHGESPGHRARASEWTDNARSDVVPDQSDSSSSGPIGPPTPPPCIHLAVFHADLRSAVWRYAGPDGEGFRVEYISMDEYLARRPKVEQWDSYTGIGWQGEGQR